MAAPDCFWVLLIVFGCSWLFLAASDYLMTAQRYAGIQTDSHTRVQKHPERHADQQTRARANTQRHPKMHPDIQAHKHTKRLSRRRTNTQTQYRAATPTHRHEGARMHRHANPQTQRPTSRQADRPTNPRPQTQGATGITTRRHNDKPRQTQADADIRKEKQAIPVGANWFHFDRASFPHNPLVIF